MTPHPLIRWIDPRMPRAEFARKVRTSEGHLSLVLARRRGLSLRLAVRIELETKRRFTAAGLLLDQERHGVTRRPKPSKPK